MQIHLRSEFERKMLHISSLWMPAFLYFFPNIPSIIVFGCLSFCGIITEIGFHKKWPILYHIYRITFLHILRTKERGKNIHFSGGIYVLISALICALFFSPVTGAMTMTVMLVSDAMSGLIGRRFGRIRICKGKSLEGSISFFTTGIIIVTLFAQWLYFPQERYILCVIATTAATLTEAFSNKLKIDDNLSVTIIFGLIMSLWDYKLIF